MKDVIDQIISNIKKDGEVYIPHILISLFIFGTILRLHGISHLPPYIDEYNHLNAAKEMAVSSDLIHIPSYTRAFIVVTFPIYLLFVILEPSLFIARGTMVLFNMLAIFPLYLLLKRINRAVALIAVVIYITNPWVIAISRTVREYAILPFYFLLLALILVLTLENLGDNISLKEIILGRSTDYKIIILIVPIIYALVIDPESSFVVALGLYAVFVFLLILRLDWSNKFNQYTFAMSIPLLLLVILYTTSNQFFISLVPQYDGSVINLFMNNPEQQWYYDRSIILILTSIIAGTTYSIASKNIVALFCCLSFIGYMYSFIFHFDRYFRPRYAFHIEIWFITIIAIGIHALSKYVTQLVTIDIDIKSLFTKENITYLSIVAIILLVSINPSQIFLAVSLNENYEGSYTPITSEFHPEVSDNLNTLPFHARYADTILVDQPNIIEWYHPDVYQNNDVRQYICRSGSGEPTNPQYAELAENNNVLIITTWRTNRGSCIENHDEFEDVELIKSGEYRTYTNSETLKSLY